MNLPTRMLLNYNLSNGYKLDTLSRNFNSEISQVPHRVVNAWKDGMYHFYISLYYPPDQLNDSIPFLATVTVQMRSAHGYLSPLEWPLLPASGILAVLYLVAATIWVVVWARSAEFTEKIHMVIGGIAVLGCIANVFMFVDLSVRNTDAYTFVAVVFVSHLIAITQASFTHLLLMVVSTGYGICRPSIGFRLKAVMFILTILSFLSSITLTVVQSDTFEINYNYPIANLVTLIIHVVVVMAIVSWITVFAIITFIYLHQRRYSGKHKLLVFSVFVICCIIVFLSQVAAFFFTIGLFTDCRKDWKYQWIYSYVYQYQNLLLLAVMMWLWRPTDDDQSYAFRPLATEEKAFLQNYDDDEEEVVLDKTRFMPL